MSRQVSLGILDRININNLLGQFRGRYIFLKRVRETMELLSFTEEEEKALEIKVGSAGRVTWNEAAEKKIKPEMYGFDGTIAKMIADNLRELEKADRLPMNHFDLFEKFVDESTMPKEVAEAMAEDGEEKGGKKKRGTGGRGSN